MHFFRWFCSIVAAKSLSEWGSAVCMLVLLFKTRSQGPQTQLIGNDWSYCFNFTCVKELLVLVFFTVCYRVKWAAALIAPGLIRCVNILLLHIMGVHFIVQKMKTQVAVCRSLDIFRGRFSIHPTKLPSISSQLLLALETELEKHNRPSFHEIIMNYYSNSLTVELNSLYLASSYTESKNKNYFFVGSVIPWRQMHFWDFITRGSFLNDFLNVWKAPSINNETSLIFTSAM